MEATLGTLEQYSHGESHKLADISTAVSNWVGSIFGCSHREMSRPFSRHGETFRVCIDCGAHRQFDSKTWESSGPYYFKAANAADIRCH